MRWKGACQGQNMWFKYNLPQRHRGAEKTLSPVYTCLTCNQVALELLNISSFVIPAYDFASALVPSKSECSCGVQAGVHVSPSPAGGRGVGERGNPKATTFATFVVKRKPKFKNRTRGFAIFSVPLCLCGEKVFKLSQALKA